MQKKQCWIAVLIMTLFVIEFGCRKEYQSKILSDNKDYIDVMSFGYPKEGLIQPLQRRYSAKSAAITVAQGLLLKRAGMEEGKVKGGIIVEEKYLAGEVCRLIYRINK